MHPTRFLVASTGWGEKLVSRKWLTWGRLRGTNGQEHVRISMFWGSSWRSRLNEIVSSIWGRILGGSLSNTSHSAWDDRAFSLWAGHPSFLWDVSCSLIDMFWCTVKFEQKKGERKKFANLLLNFRRKWDCSRKWFTENAGCGLSETEIVLCVGLCARSCHTYVFHPPVYCVIVLVMIHDYCVLGGATFFQLWVSVLLVIRQTQANLVMMNWHRDHKLVHCICYSS